MTTPNFDPALNPAKQAALVARCDYEQFTVVQSPTQLFDAGHPYQKAFPCGAPTRVTLHFECVYKKTKYVGLSLVADPTSTSVALAAVLDNAADVLDLSDLQRDTFGANPNPYAAT